MALRSDIKIGLAIKEVNGSTGQQANPYSRPIFHTGHGEFVLTSGNGVVYTLDGIANKVQQAPGIPGAGLADLPIIIQDYRNGINTVVSNNLAVARDDGSLNNWVIGTASIQNENVLFTFAGDANLYKIGERVSFSNDNFVADETIGVTVFIFPGVKVFAQTANGNRLVVANSIEVGFINVGNDPDVASNWNKQAVGIFFDSVNQIAINDAGTLAIIGTRRGDMAHWQVGVSAPVIYPAAVNPFVNNPGVATQANIASIVYSSFWGGFIILNSPGNQFGFIDETNFLNGIDSGLILNRSNLIMQATAQAGPTGAANPAGEIIVCPNLIGSNHELFLVSPP